MYYAIICFMHEKFSKHISDEDVRKEIEEGLDDFKQHGSGGDFEEMEEYIRELREHSEYSGLLKGLEENDKISYENIDHLKSLKNNFEKLEFLRSMPLADVIEYITYYASEIGSVFLSKRLERYQDLFSSVSNDDNGYDYSINIKSIKTGLLRDILYSAMLGTPEMGALKIADNRLLKEDTHSKSVATLFGYNSGIYFSENRKKGLGVYPFLIKAYENAKRNIEFPAKKFNSDITEEEIEHKAVLRLSDWLVEINKKYCRTLYYSNEPGRTEPQEALAWAQLGDRFKERILHIRKKRIPDHAISFHNIERFIGKSGDNKYGKEKSKLFHHITFLQSESSEEEKNIFMQNKNAFDINYQQQLYNDEVEKYSHKLEKSEAEISNSDLPESEKELQLQALLQKYESDMWTLQEGHEAKLEYLRNRTPSQLLADSLERQEIVMQKYEKNKSLADKALDLHFHFNHSKKVNSTNEDGGSVVSYTSKPYGGLIDWINEAPFGVIKRANKMLQEGVPDINIIRICFAEIYGDKEIGLTNEVLSDHYFIDCLIKSGGLIYISNNFSDFKDLNHNEILHKIIAANVIPRPHEFSQIFSKFKDIDPSTAYDLIELGEWRLVLENIDNFKDLDNTEIINFLIERRTDGLIHYVSKFKDINHIDTARKLIDAGLCSSMEDYLSYLGNGYSSIGHKEIAHKFIDAGIISSLDEYLYTFKDLNHNEIAHKLFDTGDGRYVLENLNCFNDLDYSIVDKLILLNNENPRKSSSYLEKIIDSTSNFSDFNYNEFANKLIETEEGARVLIEKLNNFKGLNHQEIIDKLMAAKLGGNIISHLRNFHNIDYMDLAIKLIKEGFGESVVNNISEFIGVNNNIIVHELLDANEIDSFKYKIENFNGLDVTIANKLIDIGYEKLVLENPEHFKDLNHTEILDRIIKLERADSIDRSISKFKDIDPIIANKLIDIGKSHIVLSSPTSFINLNHNEIINSVIQRKEYGIVAKYISNFSDVNHYQIANQLIEIGGGEFVASYIINFRNINHTEIAEKLIEYGNIDNLINNLSNFKELDPSIARIIIKYGKGEYVAEHLNHFSNINHKEISDKLIQSGKGEAVTNYLNNFKGLDHNDIIEKLIDTGGSIYVGRYLKNFIGVNHNNIAHEFIRIGSIESIIKSISNFKDLDSSIASRIIKMGRINGVASYLSNFKDLDSSVANELIKAQRSESIIQNMSSFNNLDIDIIKKLLSSFSKEKVKERKTHLFKYFLNNTDTVLEILNSGKDDLAYKIGSIGLPLDYTHISELPEHMSKAYALGYANGDTSQMAGSTKEYFRGRFNFMIRPESNPVTIRSILRGLEGQKFGKNFRESIENLFNTSDTEAKDMIEEIIRSDHKSASRLVRTLVQIDAGKGTKYAIDLIKRSSMPDRMFAYFIHFLSKSGGITKNAPEFLKTQGNMPIIRRIVAQNPNQLNTTLDTCKKLNITNLNEEGDTLFDAMNELASLTPKIYSRHRVLKTVERKKFVEWINTQKEELFENKKIDFNGSIETTGGDEFAGDKDIIIEMVHQAYNPINMSFENVKDLLPSIDDHTDHLNKYLFPQTGYPVIFNDVSYKIRKDETLNKEALRNVSNIFSHKELKGKSDSELLEFSKKRNAIFMKLARATTDFSDEEINIIFQVLTDHDNIINLKAEIDDGKVEMSYPILARIYDTLGIYSKDNIPIFIEEYARQFSDLGERLDKIFEDPSRRGQILKMLKIKNDDPQVEGVPNNVLLGRFFAEKVLEKQRAIIKKEMKKFQRDNEAEGEGVGEFNVYISKNKGSFFAKAAAGICTANDTVLWDMKNHFHMNIVDVNKTVQGNIQGYFETVNGNSSLVLRGFNPTEKLLKTVSPDSFMKNIIKIAKDFAQKNNLNGGVFITESLGGWHAESNRQQIREYIPKNIYSKVEPIAHHMKIAKSKTVDNIYPV